MRQGPLAGLLPVATGKLAETPFGHVVLYIHRRSQTGTLAVTDPRGGETRISFRDGKAFAAKLPWEATGLLEGLVPLCGLTAGDYAFYGELVALASALTGELDPYALIGASLERYVRVDAVETTVSSFSGTRLRLARPQRIRDLGFAPSDRPLLDLMRAEPTSPERLLQISPLGKERTERVLYALLVSNAVAPYDTQQLEEHHRRVQGSYVVALAQSGPPQSEGASSKPAPQKLEGQSNKPAPQKLEGQSNTPAPQRSGPSFVHINRVASPLTSFGPPRAPPSGPPADRSVELDRALAQAERDFKHGKHEEALFPLARLSRKHAYSAELFALQAAIMFDRDVAASEPLPAHIVSLVDEALALDPDQARALFLKGVELKRLGELSKAASYFARAVEEDSTHIAAKRELHLLKKASFS